MPKKLISIVYCVLLLAMATANILLLSQNMEMRRALAKYLPRELKAGEKVRPFIATDLDERPVSISYTESGPKRVLLYFTPKCPYCREQFPYWREILERADRGRYEVIGLVDATENVPDLKRYLDQAGCSSESGTPLPTVLIPSDVRRSYKLSATPVTLIVKNDGTVEKVWAGQWGEAEILEAGNLLGFDFKKR